MVRINWTVRALADLQEIYDYIARDSKFYARATSKKLRNRVKVLKSQIYAGGKIPELNREDLRQLIEGSYRIIYKIVNENQIDILLIHHAARDLNKRIK